MRVCNPDRSPVGINRCDTAPTPIGFGEIISDDLPVLRLMSSVARSDCKTIALDFLTKSLRAHGVN